VYGHRTYQSSNHQFSKLHDVFQFLFSKLSLEGKEVVTEPLFISKLEVKDKIWESPFLLVEPDKRLSYPDESKRRVTRRFTANLEKLNLRYKEVKTSDPKKVVDPDDLELESDPEDENDSDVERAKKATIVFGKKKEFTP
jgi:hypothetical protein